MVILYKSLVMFGFLNVSNPAPSIIHSWMQPHFFSWSETIQTYISNLFTWQPCWYSHPPGGWTLLISVPGTRWQHRWRTSGDALTRQDRYSLSVPGRRVPFCSSRSITSPASPTESSGFPLSRKEKTNRRHLGVDSAGRPAGTGSSAG
jgi:hypothetical protein